MKYIYSVLYKQFVTKDSFILRLQSKDGKMAAFHPGQFCEVFYPKYKPEEGHCYSIASSPTNDDYLEFCVKIYGDWTQKVSEIEKGEELIVSDPKGNFHFEDNDTNCVFLVGGVGISGFMSMLRYIDAKQLSTKIILLYGNRTEESIVYKQEIENILNKIGNDSKVVYILSHLPVESKWSGYRGFITKEIIKKEADLPSKPTFFMVGPPVFIDLIHSILEKLNVESSNIKEEKL